MYIYFIYTEKIYIQTTLNKIQFILANNLFICFLVPEVPSIVENGCFAEDNIVRCTWKMPSDDMVLCDNDEYGLISNAADASLMSHVGQQYEHFLLQYRQVEKDENLINKPWISVENVTSLRYNIQGQCDIQYK